MSAPSQAKRLIAAAAITGAVLGTAGIAGAATGRFTPNRRSLPAVVVKPFAAVKAGALSGQSRVKTAPAAAAVDPATGVTAVVPAADSTTTTAAGATTTSSTTVVDPAITTTTVPDAHDLNEADEANEPKERPRATTTTVAGAVTTATTVESDDDEKGDDAAEEAAEAAAKAARAAAKAAAATAAASGQPVTTVRPPRQRDDKGESESKDHGKGGGDND